ncbi:MAG: hypothetical protein NVSMB46_08190 [Candidatus Saccharimonadales bacterium]
MRRLFIVVGAIILLFVVIELVRLYQLRSNVRSYRDYWIKTAQQPRTTGSLNYIALGDSAAQAIGASSPTKGYVGLIADSLQQKTQRPIHITNVSVTGAKIADVIHNQLPRLSQLKIDAHTVVTIEIGANDMSRYDKNVFRTSFDELCSKLPPQTIVSDLPYFGGGRANNHERSAREASDIIQEITAKYNLRLARLHESTKKYDGINVYAADFFHPSNQGYKNWYVAFWDVLKQESF